MDNQTETLQPLPRGAALLPLGAWILYSVFAMRERWLAATVAGAALYLPFAALERRRSAAVKLPDLTAICFFVFGLFATGVDGPWLFQHYSLIIIWVAFATASWGSMVLGSPSALQYAREQAPREYWDAPLMLRTCRVITLVWSGVFTVNLLIVLLSRATAHPILIGSIAPIGGIVFAMIFTSRYAKRIRENYTAVRTS